MRRLVVLLALLGVPISAQSPGDLPSDVHPDSRSRLPLSTRETSGGRPDGAAAIRLHKSGVDVRWGSPLGRAVTELGIISTALEHDQPCGWALHQQAAIAGGGDALL